MELSKGIIPVDVILRVQVDKTEPRVFHIVTKGGRKYIFNAENSDEKALWTSTLLAAMMIKEVTFLLHSLWLYFIEGGVTLLVESMVVVLPYSFRGMGAQRNSAETQQSGYTPRSGPKVTYRQCRL